MVPQRTYWLEALEQDELDFLLRKEHRDRTLFYRTLTVLMVICFIIPFGFTWVRALHGVKAAFSYGYYFGLTGLLLTISGVSAYISYRVYLWRVQRDIRFHTKTIERTHITRKLFVPHNGTYHFYLDSPTRLSIEVKEKDYHLFNDGDEVNIEYSTYSKQYLGYF